MRFLLCKEKKYLLQLPGQLYTGIRSIYSLFCTSNFLNFQEIPFPRNNESLITKLADDEDKLVIRVMHKKLSFPTKFFINSNNIFNFFLEFIHIY